MKKNTLALCVASALSLLATSAQAVDWNGYFRAGMGVSDNGNMQTYKKQKIGRLGNEADAYGHFHLAQTLYDQDQQSFRVQATFAMQSANPGREWESTKTDDAEFAMRQMNVQAKGVVFGGEEVLWAGKRFYQRHDIHISDFYYWDMSGAGGGIENVPVGPGKLSFAVIANDPNEDFADFDQDTWCAEDDKQCQAATKERIDANNIDLRYAGIPIGDKATLELGYNYIATNPTDDQKELYNFKDGQMFTAELVYQLENNGINKTVFQYMKDGQAGQAVTYGTGSGSNLSQVNNGSAGIRFINWGITPINAKFDIGHQFVYGKADDLQDFTSGALSDEYDMSTLSAVVRPAYKWTNITRTYLELGYVQDDKEFDNGDTENEEVKKATIAQAWTAGNLFLSRPEIRIFATYLDVENDSKGGYFREGATDTWNVGIQAEAMW